MARSPHNKTVRLAREGKIIGSRLSRIADDLERGSLREWRIADGVRHAARDLRSCGRHGAVWEMQSGAWDVDPWGCHHRLCPYCERDRARARRKITDAIYAEYGPKFGPHGRAIDPGEDWELVTLTVPNTIADAGELAGAISRLKAGFRTLMRRHYMHTESYVNAKGKTVRREKSDAIGYVASVEITAGADGSIHPHLHAMIVWPRKYRMNGTQACKWPVRRLVNTYHRVMDRSGVVYDVMAEDPANGYLVGRTADRARTRIWVSYEDGVRESEESYRGRCLETPDSLQGAWMRITGASIADVREVTSRGEVAKYLTKPGIGRTATDDQLLAIYLATARVHRWMTGGAFHGLAARLEEEHASDDLPRRRLVGTFRALLTHPDPEIRARAANVISHSRSCPYDAEELIAWYGSPNDTGPPSWIVHSIAMRTDTSPPADDRRVSYEEAHGLAYHRSMA